MTLVDPVRIQFYMKSGFLIIHNPSFQLVYAR